MGLLITAVFPPFYCRSMPTLSSLSLEEEVSCRAEPRYSHLHRLFSELITPMLSEVGLMAELKRDLAMVSNDSGSSTYGPKHVTCS